MESTSLIAFLLIGAVAGWLAGLLMRGGSFGLLGSIVVGVIGAFAGSFLFRLVGVSAGSGLVGSLVTAVVGAAVLLFIVGLFKKGRSKQSNANVGRAKKECEFLIQSPGLTSLLRQSPSR